MNIKILDSWLKDYLKTNATPKDFAHAMSLTSVSIERMEKVGSDVLYDIEITTNRPDLMSVLGLAREAAAILPQFGFKAEFIPPKLISPKNITNQSEGLTIKNNDRLVNRILAVILEIDVKPSPKEIKERLETSDIRSLNDIIDVTNYVMRTIGHPTHVFDYDRLKTKTIVVRESRNNEKIKTLDGKEYKLTGGDIVAEDGVGNIIDLLGVMGLENSVVTEQTKRIVFFIDNNDPHKIRKTSMQHGIRTEAAQLNEKVVDSETAYDALLYGIELYQKIANGKLLTDIIDIYPNKLEKKEITVSVAQILKVIGVDIPIKTIIGILEKLGFNPEIKSRHSEHIRYLSADWLDSESRKNAGSHIKSGMTKEEYITVTVPSYRSNDITIPEDIIEEVARVYGYHNVPTKVPAFTTEQITQFDSEFYWEQQAKHALKYWGFTEVYTYPIVSEEMFEGPLDSAVTLANPLGEEFAHMRSTLIPSLLKVASENKSANEIKIFEIANIYEKQKSNLPNERLTFVALIKKQKASFFHMKGIVEQLSQDFGIKRTTFKPAKATDAGADMFIEKTYLGTIEILDEETITCEFDFELFMQHATTKKVYKSISKFPEVFEDLALIINDNILTGDIIAEIRKQNELITDVSLLDKYGDTRTFHIVYHSDEKSLTNEEVGKIREKILATLKEKFDAKIK